MRNQTNSGASCILHRHIWSLWKFSLLKSVLAAAASGAGDAVGGQGCEVEGGDCGRILVYRSEIICCLFDGNLTPRSSHPRPFRQNLIAFLPVIGSIDHFSWSVEVGSRRRRGRILFEMGFYLRHRFIHFTSLSLKWRSESELWLAEMLRFIQIWRFFSHLLDSILAKRAIKWLFLCQNWLNDLFFALLDLKMV